MHRITRIVTLLLVCSMSIFIACEGPSGSEGPQGPEGPEGPVGPAGEDGSMIYSGSGTPGSDIGDNGDYYLNTDNGDFYGPKDESGWGSPKIDLQGEDGSQIHSGTGAPDASLGAVGDYYLDKDTYELYGPKTDSGWGTPLDLKGTANVLYSSWVEFESSNWSALQTEFSMDFREYPVQAPQITEEIRNEGVVLVYVSWACCSYVTSLPDITDNTYKTYFEYVVGEIQIKRSFFPDATGDPGTYSTGNEYRYIIIPGGTSIGNSKVKKEDLKNMSYEEVKKRFGI